MKQHKSARKNGSRKRTPRKVVSRTAAPKKARIEAVALPTECVIAEIEALKADLVNCLTRPKVVTIDASALRRIDTANLQLLATFTRERRAAGRPFEWAGVPPALTDTARLLDLTLTLGLPAPEPA